MNRELKFRVWDKSSKIFRGNLYKYLINAHTGELEVWGFSDIYDEWYNTYDDKDLIVQQYTGLKDKNNVEIYEGDIVRYGLNDNEVIFVDKIAWEYSGWVFLSFDGRYSTPLFFLPSLEIIGNIFQNIDLMKKS